MEEILRTAEAHWQGDSRSGQGKLTTGSGAIREQDYTWKMRFTDEVQGTNPEELIAAAHAGCYNMSLASTLKKAGYNAESLHTRAQLTMQQEEIGWTVKRIRLDVEGVVPGLSAAEFQDAAIHAKENCPISRLLAPGLVSIDLNPILRM